MAISFLSTKLRLIQQLPSSSSSRKRSSLRPSHCSPLQQTQLPQENAGIICEPCGSRGWLLCGFCNGQKTNVKAENNRIYRRCPTCRAIGYVLCSKCKVYKCVTLPDYSDREP
ncbi:chaperone protein dnaJ-like protein [Thalictrum thalictroides]|uniref:Chaperone protein dnaJ-like protein n=1 Tax=Thalictrum thalictroides TaxID=46969 RepID=A0A7J6VJI8_THATH|nr:chaperone protein dnaJ-like protein [Thalictrum thalictroides]